MSIDISHPWRFVFYRDGIWWQRVILAAIPGVAASIIGAWLVLRLPQQFLFRALGMMLLLYVIFIYINPSFKMKRTRPFAILGGTLAGFLSGLFGVSGEATSMILSILCLSKEVFIGTGGAFMLIIDITRVIAYLGEGIRLNSMLLWGLVIFIPATLLGSMIGKIIVNRIPQRQFRKVIMAFLLVVGLRLSLFP